MQLSDHIMCNGALLLPLAPQFRAHSQPTRSDERHVPKYCRYIEKPRQPEARTLPLPLKVGREDIIGLSLLHRREDHTR